MQVYIWGCVGGCIHQPLNAGDGLLRDKMPDAFQYIKSVPQHFSRRGKETVIKQQDLHRFRAGVALHPFQPCARVRQHSPPRQAQPHPPLNVILIYFFFIIKDELFSPKSVSPALGFSR